MEDTRRLSLRNLWYQSVSCLHNSIKVSKNESSDFFYAGVEKTACKAEKIHKMSMIFTQNVYMFKCVPSKTLLANQ